MMGNKPFMIGICGRSGSGKSTLAHRIQRTLQDDTKLKVGLMSMDDYYTELSEEDHQKALNNDYDFDCLEAFDLGRLRQNVGAASRGHSVRYTKYDHANHKHNSEFQEYEAAQVWIVEGLYLFAVPDMMHMFNLRIFMEVDADESLLRRVRRDIVSRRRDVANVLNQYERYVKPAYELIVAPSRSKADISVMRGAFNDVAFQTIINAVKAQIH
jgi:uridine kinase